MGIWVDAQLRGDNWNGFPLGLLADQETDASVTQHNHQCVNVKDLGPKGSSLVNSISSFVVTGYCICEFFDNENCEGFLFDAQNRQDSNLNGRPGSPNDRIESFRCRYDDGVAVFGGGSAGLDPRGNGGATTPPGISVTIPANTIGSCVQLPLDFDLGTVNVVVDMTCEFYLDDQCVHEAFSYGHKGRTTAGGYTNWQDVLSYKCVPPYGPEYIN
ncbi:hypothetical protein TWF694_004318 [Orbilia ellipsospora]|uniref:Uncharacterized protein n=1 Tax=Orbilia ellipsospora TaxID=2528407 RepID=A0AAV9X073_9PEZI